MAEQANLLIKALCDPKAAGDFSLSEWDRCIRMARHSNVLSRLSFLLKDQTESGQIAAPVREHLLAARVVADQHERIMRWEVRQVERVLGPMARQTILLKGAAYVTRGLPPARGRLYSDLDIMVPLSEIDRVETALLQNGWEHIKLEPYDQRYYRQWMHELPPLRHGVRKTCLDVHHTILPRSGRLRPAPDLLFKAAAPMEGTYFRTLSSADMVLHSAAHLFQDGDLAGGLRDLTDLDDLLRYFDLQAGFWDDLVSRGETLGLLRPLFYALRYTRKILGTPIPESVRIRAESGSPPAMALKIMDHAVSRALTPLEPVANTPGAGFARWFLYVRSHYLRMPPTLLFVHLLRKAVRRAH